MTIYSALNTTPSQIYKEVLNMTFTRFPRPISLRKKEKYLDVKKYFEYHESHMHYTDDSIQLRDAIEQMTREGKLKKCVKGDKDSKEVGDQMEHKRRS